MPTGKYVTEQTKAEILRLRSQSLTARIIAIRVGLNTHTVYKVIRGDREEKHGFTLAERGMTKF